MSHGARSVPGIRFRLYLAIAAAALAAASPIALPGMYKWVDDDGVTHYSGSRPVGRDAQELSVGGGSAQGDADGSECRDLVCRAARLESAREDRERAAQERLDDAAKAAASYPVFPTPVEETDDERIARLVAECKARRGSDCDSDEEKRRMLLQNVDLTHEERRALRRFSPAAQRRILLQRIPKQYRNIE